MNTFNVQPRPRVLFEDVPEGELEELVRLVPSFKLVFEGEAVHETEYDILVTFAENASKRAGHLHVLSFGAKTAKATKVYDFRRTSWTLANEVTITTGLSSAATALLQSTVIPHIPEGQKYGWNINHINGVSNSWEVEHFGNLAGYCAPLLHLGTEKFVYAFSNRRLGNTGGLQLVLPGITQRPAEWLRVFLDLVADIDPASVPPDIEWKTSERWSPPEVSGVVHDLQALRDERDKALAEFHAREETLNARLTLAAQRADVGPGRLLTSDGDELTAAVREALTDLGFNVRDMDEHHDEKSGAKLEDLRVDDPLSPDWHCLAEVKGYSKGAKVNDVSQITRRPYAAYTKETGEFPSAVWHIVNAWRGRPPTARPIAVPSDDDLRPLTEVAGALVDTRDLFEAWRDVEAGKIDAGAVRASLRSALTRWTYQGPPVS